MAISAACGIHGGIDGIEDFGALYQMADSTAKRKECCLVCNHYSRLARLIDGMSAKVHLQHHFAKLHFKEYAMQKQAPETTSGIALAFVAVLFAIALIVAGCAAMNSAITSRSTVTAAQTAVPVSITDAPIVVLQRVS